MKATGYRMKNVVRLIASMKTYSRDIAITFISVFAKYLSTMCAAVLSAQMIALAINGTLASDFAGYMTGLCICVVIRGFSHFGELFIGHKAAYQIQRDTRVKIYYKFNELAPAYMNRHHTASLGTMAMSDIEILEWFFAHTVVNLIAAALMILVVFFLTMRMNRIIAGIALLFFVFLTLIPVMGAKLADKQGRAVREAIVGANAVLMEGIQGITDFVALDYLKLYKKKQKEKLEQLYQAKQDYAKRTGKESGLAQFMTGLYTILCMILCAYFVSRGHMKRDLYPIMLSLSLVSYAPIMEVSASLRNLGEMFAAADRIQKLFDEEAEVKDTGVEEKCSDQMDIEFRNVSFAYEKGKEVLHDISFRVPYGKQVALVGPSGAGKTTCASLVLRYWDAADGEILIGGQNIQRLKLDALRNITSAVLQDVYLFHISVMENIRMGRRNATDEEVMEAAKSANAHEFICSLPNGYHTVTGERGFRLSGGQRKRIAIARAILRNAPVLILDEAVSSLDAENEYLIEDFMKEHAAGRTTMVIAHRLSTIRNADWLVVIKDGRVVQQGTHEALMKEEGFYRSLMQNQFSGRECV